MTEISNQNSRGSIFENSNLNDSQLSESMKGPIITLAPLAVNETDD